LSLAFAVILSILFLGERLKTFEWIGAILVVTGVLVIIFK
ncbi:MAG: EamA family transporter, partial [Candidatus Omnitrophica bacterium]|nr:EamA family transporter [Candidatus Omnitrophota bacterium]